MSLQVISIWWHAIRYHFITSSTMPGFLGSILAWYFFDSFSLPVFLLVIVALILNQVALHLSNDYFDYRYGTDTEDKERNNLFAGGSKVLPRKLFSPNSFLIASVALFFITMLIGIYLFSLKGPAILVIGFIGGLSAVFYTAPPFKLAYRGLGELSMLVNYGLIIGVGAFIVQIGEIKTPSFAFSIAELINTFKGIPLEIYFITSVLGIIQFAMIVVQEIADYKEDVEGNKRNLIVRFGKKNGVRLHIAGLLMVYAIILVSVLLLGAPYLLLLLLVLLPLSVKSANMFLNSYNNVEKHERAVSNLLSFRIHNLTGMLLVVIYSIAGLLQGKPVFACLAINLTMILLQLPVFSIILNYSKQKTFRNKVLFILGIK